MNSRASVVPVHHDLGEGDLYTLLFEQHAYVPIEAAARREDRRLLGGHHILICGLVGFIF